MLFSVICPIYNTEQYLKPCVDSILSQSCGDFELILVDDGSPDGSAAICDDYGSLDKRVKVIHKPNGGLVSARQAGLEVASGDYIINVDSDDWLEPGYFESASKIIAEHNVDIVTFAINYAYPSHTDLDKEMVEPGLYDKARIAELIVPNMLLTPDMKHMHYFVWAKAFRREFVSPFMRAVDQRINMGEDVSVLIPSYLAASSVYVSEDVVYNCRCHDASMSRKFNPNHYTDIALGVKLLRENDINAPECYSAEIDRYCAFMCFVLMASCAEARAKQEVANIEKQWCEEFEHSFSRAQFLGITKKSKIAIKMLSKKKLDRAYSFLALCSKLKGK